MKANKTYSDALRPTFSKILLKALKNFALLVVVLKLWKKKWRNAGSEASKAPRRTPKAWESMRRRRRGDLGEWGGVSPTQPTRGSGGASWDPAAGSGAEARAKTNLVHVVAARRTPIATICLISVSLNTAVVHSHYCFERCKSTIMWLRVTG